MIDRLHRLSVVVKSHGEGLVSKAGGYTRFPGRAQTLHNLVSDRLTSNKVTGDRLHWAIQFLPPTGMSTVRIINTTGENR